MSRQVFVRREGEKVSLIVDGIGAQSKRIPGGDRTRLSGPLYVGGVPPSLTVKHPECKLHTRESVTRLDVIIANRADKRLFSTFVLLSCVIQKLHLAPSSDQLLRQ